MFSSFILRWLKAQPSLSRLLAVLLAMALPQAAFAQICPDQPPPHRCPTGTPAPTGGTTQTGGGGGVGVKIDVKKVGGAIGGLFKKKKKKEQPATTSQTNTATTTTATKPTPRMVPGTGQPTPTVTATPKVTPRVVAQPKPRVAVTPVVRPTVKPKPRIAQQTRPTPLVAKPKQRPLVKPRALAPVATAVVAAPVLAEPAEPAAITPPIVEEVVAAPEPPAEVAPPVLAPPVAKAEAPTEPAETGNNTLYLALAAAAAALGGAGWFAKSRLSASSNLAESASANAPATNASYKLQMSHSTGPIELLSERFLSTPDAGFRLAIAGYTTNPPEQMPINPA